MKIVAKTLQGHMVELTVEASDNGESVRQRIEEATGYPASDIRLVFRGQNVEDSVTLESVGVSEGDTVFMVTKVTPGGGSKSLADLADTMSNVTISEDASGQSFGFSSASSSSDMSKLADYVSGLSSRDEGVLYNSVLEIRKLLAVEQNPPIGEVISSGSVPLLVDLVRSSSTSNQVKFEAAWALTNIASGTSEHTRTVVEKGGLDAMLEGLLSDDTTVREQCTWGLGNIAGDSVEMRNRCYETEAVGKLVAMLGRDPPLSLQRNIVWCLSNLVRGKPGVSLDKARPVLGALSGLIHSGDDEILTDATWGLSYISDGENERIQAVIESGVVPRVVELMTSTNQAIVTPALRVIGNIMTGSEAQTQYGLNAGVLPILNNLLDHPRRAIRKEACWTLSNITAGSRAQIQMVIDNGVMPKLCELLRTAEFDVKKEAAWAISNASMGGSNEQVQYLFEIGCVEPMGELLLSQDSRITQVALEFLSNVARNADSRRKGVMRDVLEDNLEQLTSHEDSRVFEMASTLLEQLFEEVQEEPVDGSVSNTGVTVSSVTSGSEEQQEGAAMDVED